MSRWRDANKVKPRAGVMVMIYIPRYPGHSLGEWTGNYWNDYCEPLYHHHSNEVSHWMTLPRSPKERNEG